LLTSEGGLIAIISIGLHKLLEQLFQKLPRGVMWRNS
jgi:hypothetical protein